MTTTNPRPERTFTQAEAQAMYDFIRTTANFKGNGYLTRLLVNDASKLLQALDAPQTAGTGEQRHYFIRRYQKQVSSIFYETPDGKFVWIEDSDTYEDAKRRVRELNVQAAVDRIPRPDNAQPAADTGDEREGTK